MFLFRKKKSQAHDHSSLDSFSKRQVAFLIAHTALIRIAMDFLAKNRIKVASDTHRFDPDLHTLQELPVEKLSQLLVMKSDLYDSIEAEDYSSVIDPQIGEEELKRSLLMYESEEHDLPYLNRKMTDDVFLDYLWILESGKNKMTSESVLAKLAWWNVCETF